MIEVLQVASELEFMRRLYREHAPKRVLEVGSWQGGTLREWLASEPELVVAVDLNHQRPDLYETWRKPKTSLEVITGSSQDPAIIATIRRLGPYDWVFIDGDHEEPAVRSDVEVALPLISRPGGVLLLHDIARGIENVGAPGPEIVLAELGEHYETEIFIDEKPEHWAHGVGVVYL